MARNGAFERESYIDRLMEVFQPDKPLARMIDTGAGYFLYDTGTNKILKCREEVFRLLDGFLKEDVEKVTGAFINRYGEQAFREAAAEILEAVEQENILKFKQAAGFDLSEPFGNIENDLNNNIKSINLQLTQECNLRCQYCIYQGHVREQKDFGSQSMTSSMVKKAVDFLKKHSTANKRVYITFYGGEPLLEFPLLKECVQYAKETIDKQELFFTITTNGTLITPPIARYLMENDFVVTVSFDGPAEFHDQYRTDAGGKGSFDRTFNGLKLLAEARKEVQKGDISINIVYTPPFSASKLDTIRDYINRLDWLPEIYLRTSYPTEGSIEVDRLPENWNDGKTMLDWAYDKYREEFDGADAMVKGVIEGTFARLMQRDIFPEPPEVFSLHGCCLPGQKKCYVSTNGDFHVCEKMASNAPVIGHLDTGFNLDAIKKRYIDEYAAWSFKDCSRCWGIQLCNLCYNSAYNAGGELDIKKRRRHCGGSLKALENSLAYFITLLRKYPQKLDYLYGIDLE